MTVTAPRARGKPQGSGRGLGSGGTLNPTPALVLCCSKAGLAVTRGLGRAGVPVVAVCFGRGQVAAASRYATARERAPDPNEDEAAFLEFLLDAAGKWTGAVVFPTDDAT